MCTGHHVASASESKTYQDRHDWCRAARLLEGFQSTLSPPTPVFSFKGAPSIKKPLGDLPVCRMLARAAYCAFTTCRQSLTYCLSHIQN